MKLSGTFRYLLPALVVLTGINSCRSLPPNENMAAAIIDSIGNRLVPDQRMGIFNIALRISGKPDAVLTGTTTDTAAPRMIIKALDKYYKNLIDSVIILPDTLNNKKYLGLACLSVINMRKEPSHSSELVSQALMGTPVRILGTKKGWYLIQTPDQYLGWVETSSVAGHDKAGMEIWRHSDRVIYTGGTGNIYTLPEEGDPVSDIVAGCILVAEGESHGFVGVRMPDGRKGFIRKSEVADFDRWRSTISCTGTGIVNRASSLTGIPYLWGGTSVKAVDCSGFSKTVYFMNGIILQRDASQQALHGRKIDISSGYSELEPGDLLFFGVLRDTVKHVTHVAVYEGNNRYINASGRVIVNSLDPASQDYNKSQVLSLLSARRVIGTEDDPGIIAVIMHPWY